MWRSISAAASGHLELNVYKPLIIDAFLQSARLLADGSRSFEEHCVRGIEPNEPRIRELLEGSLMLVTALSPHIGYDRAAEIAKKAHRDGSTLREAALASGHVTAAQYDEWVRPRKWSGPAEHFRADAFQQATLSEEICNDSVRPVDRARMR